MADRTTTSEAFKAEWLFVDGDTRVFTMKNPKATITSSEVTDLETLILNASESGVTLLVGDKTGSPFRRINTAVRETITTTILDIGN